MQFTFNVSIELNRTEGKFATRDELEEQLIGVLEGADEGQYEGENGGQYETMNWEVTSVSN